jgi:DNA-binding transcriptional ArsR family regulator
MQGSGLPFPGLLFMDLDAAEGSFLPPHLYSTKWLTSAQDGAMLNHMVEYSTETLDGVFHALSDATRRGILQQLTAVEKTVGEIAQPYHMSLAAVSKHLQVLERADLVRFTKKGNYRFVRLRADTLRVAQDWLAHYEQFWQARLDALVETLETDEDEI